MEQNVLIQLRNIKFGYTENSLLFNDLNLTLRKGERIGLIGPNGCGKTTLLYIIMGLVTPSSGEVEIFGKVRKAKEDFEEVRKKIGLVFQNSDDQLFCPAVKEEVAFGPLNLGRQKEEVRKIIKEVLAKVGLTGFEDRTPHTLSAGEKKRLALAAVFAMKPEILLLDEPTAGLDQESTEKFIEILKKEYNTYIIVSQDKEVLKKTAGYVFTIEKRKLNRINL